jgi:integrase
MAPLQVQRGAGQFLTDADVDAWPGCTKPGQSAKLADGNGMFVHQRTPGGQKVFRLRVRVRGAKDPEDVTLGNFPQMSVDVARQAAVDARALASEGFSPTTFRKVHLMGARIDERALFGTIADLYWQSNTDSKFWDPKYSQEVRGHLDNHLKPHLLWKTPMCTASVPVAMGLIERCAQDSVSIAYKVLSLVRATANHAIEIGCIDATPLTSLRPNSRIRKYRQDSKKGKRNYPAILEIERLAIILRDNHNSPACFQVRLCHVFLAHTAVRVSNAVALKWAYLDLENAVASFPRDIMKTDDRRPMASDRGWRAFHDVPLSPQMVAMLRELEPQSEYVFFSPYNKATHITAETIEKHFREGLGLAGLHSPHSWRSAFSTWANAQTAQGRREFDRDDIELVLDHMVGSSLIQTYNRGVAIERLRPILCAWADALEVSQEALIVRAAQENLIIDAAKTFIKGIEVTPVAKGNAAAGEGGTVRNCARGGARRVARKGAGHPSQRAHGKRRDVT